jgi:hypothetical protein
MSITYQINNIKHVALANKKDIALNIKYFSTNNWYDLFLSEIGNYHFVDSSTIDRHMMPYGLAIVNNFMDVAENLPAYKSCYANKVIFIHGSPPPMLKKEDLYLINKEVSRYKIYSFIPIQDKFPSAEYIYYGFNTDNYKVPAKDRTIDISILCHDNIKQANSLKNLLSKKYNSIEVIQTNTYRDTDKVLNQLNKTKICIDLSSVYNNLLAISCGCCCITNTLLPDEKFIHAIVDINDIYHTVNKILEKYDESYILETQNYIAKHYAYDKFKHKMTNIIETNYKLPVTL